MRYLKPVGTFIAIICAVSLWVFLSARSDYKWADLIIEEESTKGWAIITEQDNFADIAAPWTLIKTPVTGLWFIDNANTKQLNQEIYLIHTLRVSYDYSRTDKEESLEIVNIRTRESAFLDPQQDFSTLNINKLKWYKYEDDTPGYQIIQYMVNYDKNH